MSLTVENISQVMYVFNCMKARVYPNLVTDIPSVSFYYVRQFLNPPLETVLGSYKDVYGRWYDLFFVVSNPSLKQISEFDTLKSRVKATSFSQIYKWNGSLWVFGFCNI